MSQCKNVKMKHHIITNFSEKNSWWHQHDFVKHFDFECLKQ